MTAPRDWSPDPEPWHEPSSVRPDMAGMFWLAFIVGVLHVAVVVGAVALVMMWGRG